MHWKRRVDGLTDIGRALVDLLRAEEVSFLAAAIAYYAFVSLVPSLMLLLAVASVLGGDDLATSIVEATGRYLSPVGQSLIGNALGGASARAPATVVGFALLVWSTLKVFRGLDIAFSRIYGTEPAPTLLGRIRDATVALGAVGLGLVVLVVIGAFVSYSGVELAGLLGTVASVVVLAVVFLPLFYLFPGTDETVGDVLPGVFLAAVGWTVLATLFRIYAGAAGEFDLYGVLGVALLLVTWYYLGSLVLLAGAGLNAVRTGQVAGTGSYNRHAPDSSTDERA